MTRTENPHELVGAYALNALEADERARSDAHLRSCSACQIEVAEFHAIAAVLAEQNTAEPPVTLKAAILTELADTRQTASTGNSIAAARFRWALILLAFALLAITALVFVRPDADPTVSVISDPGPIVATLDATFESQEGTVQVVGSTTQDHVLVIASNLGDPGEGRVYALWILLEDGLVPAGLFAPDDGLVTTAFEVEDRPVAAGWNVTIEPERGSHYPTTPVLYAGN